jgi:hypothetical protein
LRRERRVADPGEVSAAALHQILGPLIEALAEEWHRAPAPRRAAASVAAAIASAVGDPDAAEERLHDAARDLREAVAGALRDRLARIDGTVFLQTRCIGPRPRGVADEIATFYGHHDARCRTRGLVFTSARIDPATEALAADHGVILVDRERLIGLMIEHGVGVSNETIRFPRLDEDVFDGVGETEGDAAEELALAAG